MRWDYWHVPPRLVLSAAGDTIQNLMHFRQLCQLGHIPKPAFVSSETRSLYLIQADLKIVILHPMLPKCWD